MKIMPKERNEVLEKRIMRFCRSRMGKLWKTSGVTNDNEYLLMIARRNHYGDFTIDLNERYAKQIEKRFGKACYIGSQYTTYWLDALEKSYGMEIFVENSRRFNIFSICQAPPYPEDNPGDIELRALWMAECALAEMFDGKTGKVWWT